MKAADVMVSKVITVRTDTTVEKIAETLLANRISAVPVLDDAGKLVGIVSEGDLIHRVEAGTERRRGWWLELLAIKDTLAHEFIKSHARKAGDLMSFPVVTVGPDTPLGEVAFLLDKHRIKRVPVVDGDKLVGIVSRADLIQALVTPQREAAAAGDVADSVARLQSEPWWPSEVNVVVRDGSVELWGIVESDLERDAIRVAVETMPGVHAIANHLTVGKNFAPGW